MDALATSFLSVLLLILKAENCEILKQVIAMNMPERSSNCSCSGNITALNFLPVWKSPIQPLPNSQSVPKARVSLMVVYGLSLTSYSP